MLLTLSFLVPALLGAQEAIPVDYWTQIQPIFEDSCGGGFCHVDLETSGVELTDYERTVASIGEQYETAIVVPGNPDLSPLWDKISGENPQFGDSMPWGDPLLPPGELAVIERWIQEGAREFRQVFERGDVDSSGVLDLTDVIAILGHLYLGEAAPPCPATADVDASLVLDLTDPIFLLGHLYLGGPAPVALTREDQLSCNTPNRIPDVDPIGTLLATAGVPLEFQVVARDADDDALIFLPEQVPAGLELDAATGRATWTPGFEQQGDHRIRIAVSDIRAPERQVVTTGLIRVSQGNLPPAIQPPGTIYGRETVPLSFTPEASDPDGDDLTFTLLDGPEGLELDATTGELSWTPAVGQAGEHPVRLEVTDDGTPPLTTPLALSLVIVDRDSPDNQPPRLRERGVYRTYPGFPIRFSLEATDPDEQDLLHEAEDLPAGAELDPETGEFTWTPTEEQLGPFYVPVRVTDAGVPPQSVEQILVFKVSPPDGCVTPRCDEALGCDPEVLDLEQDCCQGEPDTRVAEPVSPCPGGRVLFVGRNTFGFGRLQNCDSLRVRTQTQGGVTVRLNVEARCLDTSSPVALSARLETSEYLLFDAGRNLQLQPRNDGFAQALALTFAVDLEIPLEHFLDTPAVLTVTVTDAGGVELRRVLRVNLTRDFLEGLPDPDHVDVPSDEVGCVGCHRPRNELGERVGIEDPHPWFPLSCTDCHGGNPEAFTRLEAHVSPGEGPALLRALTSDELDAADPDYLRFVNPGDLRVAATSCGSSSPAAGGGNCHQAIVETSRLSVMNTYAGHYTLPRYLSGSQERADGFTPLLAAIDVVDPEYDPETAPPGTTGSFEALRGPDPAADRATIQACMDIYLPKSCPTCHTDAFGPNNAAGNYRSSGCTSCHMHYADDGLSRSADPVIDQDFPPHPVRHELTSAIPVEQCGRCHFQGGRIGLAFRGIREGGFPTEKTPPHAVPLGRELHAHEVDYYFTDEDSTNDHDETPPDLHFTAGMVCADCHVGADVHGDGYLYVSERHQVGVRCEDCHGTVRQALTPDPDDGLFRNSRGSVLRRLRQDGEGRIFLKLATADRELEVPQIQRQLQSGQNQAMVEAMGVNESGFSHTDSMECYTCHTSWRLTCFGCHVTIDDRLEQKNKTTGEITLGGVAAERIDYSIDFFALGVNERGKLSPLCSSMSMFMSYIDETGQKLIDRQVRTSGDGKLGNGWNPFHHHTVSRVPQNCDRCHPNDPSVGVDNSATVRATYGFGTGEFFQADGQSVLRDQSAFLDEDGNLIADFPHPGTGPVPRALRERAMSIHTIPHPRQETD